MTNIEYSALRRSPNPFSFRTLGTANLRLPVLGKVSERYDQPDDHGKPDSGDNEPKKGFYKLHAAGDLHYPPSTFSNYIFRFLRLPFAGKKHDGGDQSEDHDKQRDRGNYFNQEFHNFYLEAESLRTELFRSCKKKSTNQQEITELNL